MIYIKNIWALQCVYFKFRGPVDATILSRLKHASITFTTQPKDVFLFQKKKYFVFGSTNGALSQVTSRSPTQICTTSSRHSGFPFDKCNGGIGDNNLSRAGRKVDFL